MLHVSLEGMSYAFMPVPFNLSSFNYNQRRTQNRLTTRVVSIDCLCGTVPMSSEFNLNTLVYPLKWCKTLCEGKSVKSDHFSIIDSVVECCMDGLSTRKPTLMINSL
jgi:hypothetical protein